MRQSSFPKRSYGRRVSDHVVRARYVFGLIRELLWLALIGVSLLAGDWDRVFAALTAWPLP